MAARLGTTPIFADSPPERLRGGWEFAARFGDVDGRPAAAPRTRRPWVHWLTLVLLIVLGGAIRFAWLDRPPLWGDEAATYWRVMGTYDELLVSLGDHSRFMPLHYEAYWALANPEDLLHLLKFDFAGFVREQAIDPGGQRRLDPRMMRLIPAICGTLMIPAMYLLARQLLSRRASLMAAAFTAFSAYLFVYSRDAKMYMPFFLALTTNAACFFWWMRTRSSLAWLGWIAAGSAALGLHMSGFGVIGLQPIYLLTQRRPHWLQGVLFVVGLGLMLAGPLGYYFFFNFFTESEGIQWVEWRNRGAGPVKLVFDSAAAYLYAWNFIPESNVSSLDPDRVKAATAVMIGLLACCVVGALPWSMKLRGDSPADPPREAWWRNVLWLGLWVVVPVFAVYCLSFPREATRLKPAVVSPLDWLSGLWTWLTAPWLDYAPGGPPALRSFLQMRLFLIVSGMVLMGALSLLWRPIPRALAAAAGFATLVLLVVLALNDSGLAPLHAPQDASQARQRDWIYLLALITVPPLLWYFAGRTLVQRTKRAAALLMVIGVLWGACYVTYRAAPEADGSVWMPRYVAFIWPAVALGVSALIVRIPTRPLRWAAIALLLGVNVAQAVGRVFIGNEPPVDRVVADVMADAADPETITLTPALRDRRRDPSMPIAQFNGAPGAGTVANETGRYYFVHQLDEPVSGTAFRRWRTQRHFPMHTQALTPQWIKTLLQREPKVRRLIVWEQYPEEAAALADDRGVAAALGDGWHLADIRCHNVRFFWSWADLYTYCRREYLKEEASGP